MTVERPILFNGEMVRAILDGRKTQDRRVVKQVPHNAEDATHNNSKSHWWWWQQGGLGKEFSCPFGVPGDRLWVREKWRAGWPSVSHIQYFADKKIVAHPNAHKGLVRLRENPGPDGSRERWRPSIHMPRWASRITLEITAVRVERLNNISDADAKAEGVSRHDGSIRVGTNYRAEFACLWESINGDGSWAANPWVWVVEFRRAD